MVAALLRICGLLLASGHNVAEGAVRAEAPWAEDGRLTQCSVSRAAEAVMQLTARWRKKYCGHLLLAVADEIAIVTELVGEAWRRSGGRRGPSGEGGRGGGVT